MEALILNPVIVHSGLSSPLNNIATGMSRVPSNTPSMIVVLTIAGSAGLMLVNVMSLPIKYMISSYKPGWTIIISPLSAESMAD